MSIRHTLVDFLGNVLGEDGTPTGSKVFEAAERCRWMEVARSVIESYVIASLQMSDVRIYYDDGPNEASDHTSWLWNVSPNPNQSRAAFVSTLVHEALNKRDGALVVPVYSHGQPRLYVSDGFATRLLPGRENRYEHVSIEGSTEVGRRSYRASDVYHFDIMPCPGWDEMMRLATDEYQKLGDAAESAFEDAGAMRYKLRTEIPINGKGDQMDRIADYIEESMRPFLKGERGVLPVYKGFDIERLASASSAASWRKSEDIIAIRNDMFDTVASCFRVPVSLIYGNTNNFKDVWTSAMTFCVDPIARAIADEIARKTLTEKQWTDGGRVVVDTSRVKHVEIFDVAADAEKLVGSQINSPNELRVLTRQRPVDAPGMDDYQRTKNFETAGGGNTDE